MSRYLIDLRSRAAGDPRSVGGKGVGLNRLYRWGFNVPPGFVVTTLAFRDFLASLHVESAGLGDPIPETPDRMYDAIRTAPVPPRIRREVLSAYARLGPRVAVRSSAAGEDARGASHAGQFETCLDIGGEEDLIEALRACWASRFTDRAAAYLLQRGLADDAAMAVVVQRMVPAVAAGVAFSADPISGQPCVVIEATRGLGTIVVGGTGQADHYVVDGRGVLTEVTPVAGGWPVLREAEIAGLAQVVIQIERRANQPQDVEWAWDGAAFHILQARPVTTLQTRHVYSSRIVSDMAPGLVKPMVYDVNTLATVREIFGALFGALLGTKDVDTSRFVARLHSRVYADITVLGEQLVAAGLPANLFEVMLRDERSSKTPMRLSPRLLAITARMIPLVFDAGRLGGNQVRRLDEGDRNLAPFRQRDWSAVEMPELLAELDGLIDRRDRLSWFFFCCVFNSAVRTKLLRGWVERKAPGVAFGDLIRGLAGLKSLEPSQELIRLGAQAGRLDEQVRLALLGGDDAGLRRMLADSEQGRAVLLGVDAFLKQHGFLSSNGSDFSAPSWNENPSLVWRSIARGAASTASRQATSALAIREAACARVRISVRPWERWVFGRLMAGAGIAIDLRERTSGLVSEYTYEMRRLFLAVARQLVADGRLAEVEDVFHLVRGEMRDLAQGLLSPTEAAVRIRDRRGAMDVDAALDPPEIIVGVTGQGTANVAPCRSTESTAFLSGIGGSPGIVRGFARIVYDPVQAPPTLGHSDILVVPFSDVGWTPLFAGIGGIVAETGGQLSHAAIVAREYNLPAVVSVRDATRRICDGQAVTVDGTQGRVYLETLAV